MKILLHDQHIKRRLFPIQESYRCVFLRATHLLQTKTPEDAPGNICWPDVGLLPITTTLRRLKPFLALAKANPQLQHVCDIVFFVIKMK